MTEHVFVIQRSSDQKVIQAFTQLAERSPALKINVNTSGAAFAFDPKQEDQDDNIQELINLDGDVITEASTNVYGLQITYRRGRKGEPKSPIFDDVTITQSGNTSGTVPDRLKLVACVGELFQRIEIGKFPDGQLTPEQSEVLSLRTGTLERLERLTEDLIERSSKFRADLERDHAIRIQDLDKQADARRTVLEDQYSAKAILLAEREAEIKETARHLDDRNNTHARRDIRNKMLDDVKLRIESFGVSAATERKRKPVQAGIFLLASAFLSALLYSIMLAAMYPTALESIPLYLAWVRIALTSFGLAATILYYIRWENHWAEQHAAAEFSLQQFYLDVNRSNWAVESCLEWFKETKSSIPDALLTSITNNLFVKEADRTERVLHPADELASALLGTASNLKLKVGENEISFDKPAKIAKAVTTGESPAK